MIVRALDGAHDWTFGRGRNDYLSQKKAVEQNINTRLFSFLGDCFFATQDGLDWWNLNGAKDTAAVTRAVAACLINTAYITSVIEISVTLNQTRNIQLTYSVNTSFGIVQSSIITPVSNAILTEDGSVITTEDGDILVTE